MNTINSVLFDLDGTLTDPKVGIVNSILFALDQLMIVENNVQELDAFIGPPLRDSFAGRYNLSHERADLAVQYYREYYAERGIFENNIYDGVHELLEYLTGNNFRLFVATSKPTVFAQKVLEHFELTNYFSGIAGSNLDNTRSDKTEIIAHVLSEYKLEVSNSVMIGDRKFDIIGAQNNSMQSIAVTYGYGTIEEINNSRPDFIVNDCNELKDFFKIRTAIK
ncbi:MAG: HAD family hydrolase [Bacteroidota bacterium]